MEVSRRIIQIAICISVILISRPLEVSSADAPPVPNVPSGSGIVYSVQSSTSQATRFEAQTVDAQQGLGGLLSGWIASFLGNQLASTVASMAPAVAPLAPKISELYTGFISPQPSVEASSRGEQFSKLEFLETRTFTITASADRQDVTSELNDKVTKSSSIIYLLSNGTTIELDNLKKTFRQRPMRPDEPYFAYGKPAISACTRTTRTSDERTKMINGLLAHHTILSGESMSDAPGCSSEPTISAAGDSWVAYIDPVTGADLGMQAKPFQGLPVTVGRLLVLQMISKDQRNTITRRSMESLSSYNGLVPFDPSVFVIPNGYQPGL